MMSDLPSAIQIGALSYSVLEHKPLTDASNCWGRIEHGNQMIYLDPAQGPDHKAVTIVHELLHGVWHIAGVGGDGDEQERVITALAPTLLDALRRNPLLLDYLLNTDADRRATTS